jgi:hypothetical protein
MGEEPDARRTLPLFLFFFFSPLVPKFFYSVMLTTWWGFDILIMSCSCDE